MWSTVGAAAQSTGDHPAVRRLALFKTATSIADYTTTTQAPLASFCKGLQGRLDWEGSVQTFNTILDQATAWLFAACLSGNAVRTGRGGHLKLHPDGHERACPCCVL